MSIGETYLLQEKTIFPDLNRKEGKPSDYLHESVKIFPLKHKNLRKMQSLADADQMHYALMTITGLSDHDIGELSAQDSVILTQKIYQTYLKKFIELGKEMREQVGD